jgi:hypothetical protein
MIPANNTELLALRTNTEKLPAEKVSFEDRALKNIWLCISGTNAQLYNVSSSGCNCIYSGSALHITTPEGRLGFILALRKLPEWNDKKYFTQLLDNFSDSAKLLLRADSERFVSKYFFSGLGGGLR